MRMAPGRGAGSNLNWKRLSAASLTATTAALAFAEMRQIEISGGHSGPSAGLDFLFWRGNTLCLFRASLEHFPLGIEFGCPTLAAYLFLRLGWDSSTPSGKTL